ncbi:MAG: DNA translocase FtsK 4TM domain-containing protein [Akkermansia sp.]|nr:DNA translocase FtsK 4TM domain-containing protein [Akkermansia sp.]
MDLSQLKQPEQPPQATWPTRLWGLGIVLLAVAFATALLTYNRGEMGWIVFNPVDAEAAAKVPCTNALGTIGLYMAGFCYWLLGAASVYCMLLLSILGSCILIFPSRRFAGQVIATICMVLFACAALSIQPYILQQWAANIGIDSVGGKLGYLDGRCIVEPLIGRDWSLTLFICAHGLALIYFARMGFLEFCRAFWADCNNIADRIRARRERRRSKLHEMQENWHQHLDKVREENQNPIFNSTLAETDNPPAPVAQPQPQPQAQPVRRPVREPLQIPPRQAPLPPRQSSGVARNISRSQRTLHLDEEPPTELAPDFEQHFVDTPPPARRTPPPIDQLPGMRASAAQPTPQPRPTAPAEKETPRERPRHRDHRDTLAARSNGEERRNNLLDLMGQVENAIELSNAPGASEEQEREALKLDKLDKPGSKLSRLFARAKQPQPAEPQSSPHQAAPKPAAAKSAPLSSVDKRPQEPDYPLPPYELLDYKPVPAEVTQAAASEMMEMQQRIIDTLDTFKIAVSPGDITRGPSITRYEFFPPRGLRVNRIATLNKDLMMSTQSKSVNILAPIPGKATVGIELENAQKSPVYLRELLQSDAFNNPKLRIPVALGKDVYGNPVIGDLAAMPHTLVAGTTGSGKSVCINSMILSMLYKFRPDELKLILVDPKMVEMQPYRKLPHLACPVVTVAARVIGALRWAVNEMEHRYKLFSQVGVRNFEDFNNRPPDEVQQPEEPAIDESYVDYDAIDRMESEILRQAEEGRELTDEDQDEFDFDEEERIPTRLPYVVIIIDELADLMVMVKDDLESNIARLTQKARAAGIHLVAATQTPRANVVTGLIKANIPSRIAFRVASPLDSRIILDTTGAENLLGAGDCLFLPPGGISKMTRVQGAWVSDREIASIIQHCASHAKQNFEQGVTAEMNNSDGSGDGGGRIGTKNMSEEDSELYTRCVNLVITSRKASTSMLQRHFSIGYGKAAKIMDMMEANGIIAPSQGSARAREVLVDPPN